MSKESNVEKTSKRVNLTRNARWIVVQCIVPPKFFSTSKPYKTDINIGRWSYNVPTEEAIREMIIPPEKGEIRHVFLLDVSLYPYAKDWPYVNAAADKYFRGKPALTQEKNK